MASRSASLIPAGLHRRPGGRPAGGLCNAAGGLLAARVAAGGLLATRVVLLAPPGGLLSAFCGDPWRPGGLCWRPWRPRWRPVVASPGGHWRPWRPLGGLSKGALRGPGSAPGDPGCPCGFPWGWGGSVGSRRSPRALQDMLRDGPLPGADPAVLRRRFDGRGDVVVYREPLEVRAGHNRIVCSPNH